MNQYFIIPCPVNTIAAMGDGPFAKLAKLLSTITPNCQFGEVVNLHLGEPDGAIPQFAADYLQKPHDGWAKYPTPTGSDSFRAIVANWATNRFGLDDGFITQANILPLSGTREGLFVIGAYCVMLKQSKLSHNIKPITIFLNPFYHVYKGAAFFTQTDSLIAEGNLAQVVADLPEEILKRVAQVILCSPDNPTGRIMPAQEYRILINMAKKYDFLIVADECYSEIYFGDEPKLSLPIAQELNALNQLIVANSLSKRSGAPGLRSGIVIADTPHIQNLNQLRSHISCIPPAPIIGVSELLWADNAHVALNRQKYLERLNIARQVFGNHQALRIPDGGLFLNISVPNGEKFTQIIYQNYGIKILPARYMAFANPDTGLSAGDDFVRVAMLQSGEKWLKICQALYETIKQQRN